MPFYDFKCTTCDWQDERLTKIGEAVPCPTCGSPTEKVWTTRASSVQDVTYPGGLTVENLGPRPVTFYSRSEHMRYLKEHGYKQVVRHVGLRGSDKSPHTVRWVSAPVITEEERLKAWHADEARLQQELAAKKALEHVTPAPLVIAHPEDITTR